MLLSRHSSGKRGQQEVSAGCLVSFESGHRLLQCQSEEHHQVLSPLCVLLSCPQFCFCSIKLKTWKKKYIFEWHFKKMFKMLMLKHFEFNRIMKGISSNVEQFLLFEMSNIMWPLVITLLILITQSVLSIWKVGSSTGHEVSSFWSLSTNWITSVTPL